MNGTRQREVGGYLRRLQRSMKDLPARRRDEILAEVEEHIEESLAELPDPSDADVRNVLDRVGDPDDIATEARERFGVRPATRRGTDVAAIILLLFGGFLLLFGWFVGLVLLWISEVWTVRDKIIGTLIVPGGLAGSLFVSTIAVNAVSCVGIHNTCGSGSSVLGPMLLILFAIAPILTAVYLGLRLRRLSS